MAIALAAQPLANDSFQIRTSPSGLTSLKRVHDGYDTDYIAGGRALGNVLVRYKLPAETSWQTALYPTARSQSGFRVSYRIGRAIPTIATSSKSSASYRRMPLGALSDQIEAASSSDETVPRFLWIDRSGTREWVQYDFSKPESVSSVQVYWFQHKEDERPCLPPESWRVLYLQDGDWKEVRGASVYGVALNQYNQVAFDPVTTSALRLAAKNTCGGSTITRTSFCFTTACTRSPSAIRTWCITSTRTATWSALSVPLRPSSPCRLSSGTGRPTIPAPTTNW